MASDVERLWHTQDSRGQILALACRLMSPTRFKLCTLRLAACLRSRTAPGVWGSGVMGWGSFRICMSGQDIGLRVWGVRFGGSLSGWECAGGCTERELCIDNLLVRIHCIAVMIRWTGPVPWELEFPFPGSLTSTSLAGDAQVVEEPLPSERDRDKVKGFHFFLPEKGPKPRP